MFPFLMYSSFANKMYYDTIDFDLNIFVVIVNNFLPFLRKVGPRSWYFWIETFVDELLDQAIILQAFRI